MKSTTRSTSPIASAREQLPTMVRGLAWWISHPSEFGVQSMQQRGYGCLAVHACTHCRTHSEGARDIRCVWLLRFLHNCAPVLQQARGKRGGQPTEVSGRTDTTTLQSRSSRLRPPGLQRQVQAKVHQLPCTLPHLQDGGVEVRNGAAQQRQAHRH
jgi:hypothetical protein